MAAAAAGAVSKLIDYFGRSLIDGGGNGGFETVMNGEKQREVLVHWEGTRAREVLGGNEIIEVVVDNGHARNASINIQQVMLRWK